MNSHDYSNFASSSFHSSGQQTGMRGPPVSENMQSSISRAYVASASSSDTNLMPSIAPPIQKTSYVRQCLIVPDMLLENKVNFNCVIIITETISVRRVEVTFKLTKTSFLLPSIQILYDSFVDGISLCFLTIFLAMFLRCNVILRPSMLIESQAQIACKNANPYDNRTVAIMR
jgi:hypothetical protein